MPDDSKTIDLILSELYAADPALKGRETELRGALTKLLAAKPVAEHDAQFIASLREDLLKKFGDHQATAASGFTAFMQRPWFAVPAAAFAVLLLAIAVVQKDSLFKPASMHAPTHVASESQNGGVHVTQLAAGNFGTLVATGAGVPSQASGMGGGGGGQAMSADAAKMAAPMAVGDAPARVMMPPDGPQTVFTYAYKGSLELPDAQLPVLRRVKGMAGVPFSDAMAGNLPNFFDISRLDGLKVQNFAAYQDKPFGYALYADLNEESVSISQYYAQWPHPEQQCRDQSCYESLRLHEGDMLGDDQSVALADRFLGEIGVSKDGFGAPEVRNEWRRWYAATPVKSDYWFPDAVSVIYPMLVDGTQVVEDGGYPYGLMVNVNVRQKRADGIYNLYSRNYESAPYDAVTDPAAILDIVSRGGMWGYVPEGDVRKIEIELGEPERVLIRTWQYAADGSLPKELLAPGLRFPVIDPQRAEHGTPDYVTVTLIKELLTKPDGGMGGGPIMLMKGGEVAPSVAPAAMETKPAAQ